MRLFEIIIKSNFDDDYDPYYQPDIDSRNYVIYEPKITKQTREDLDNR